MIDLHLQKKLHTSEGDQLLDVAFRVREGSLLALYGESGVGKTTLLRMLAGLTLPDGGYIRVAGKSWFEQTPYLHLPPQKREVGLVFQQYALFPHMTVRQNLEYALETSSDQAWVNELLQLSQLTELAHRRPSALSGGQQQRVALIRALARKPRILLLDEPLSSLDSPTRRRLQQEIRRLHEHFRMTTLLVSHDADEVARMADEVIVLERGKISQQGHPFTLFPQHPNTIQAEGAQVVWIQGTIRTITASDKGWVLGLEMSTGLQQIQVQTDVSVHWQAGDLVTLPLSVSPPLASQIQKL